MNPFNGTINYKPGVEGGWGYAVVQFVEALRYQTEGRGFDSLCCHWNFSFIQSFGPKCGPGVNSVAKRNEYQEYSLGGKGGRCVGLTTLLASCAHCLEIWEPQPPGNLKVCPGLFRDSFFNKLQTLRPGQ